ncbi:hypothetical protein B0J11DRAFT_305826 [Dendryphion nanum]|uniref:Dystroglycan-type cadherin-like domain-containing protein n=1 Tax=Dendryphion nanum TaxID=256645 RepID=A0A9P9DTF6_9PLEO|nr:hypothetical protein B0J11DRAFT_305826 [Dendryphion nanum]
MMTKHTIEMWPRVLVLFATWVAASPQVNFPLNSQFPPVAHIGQPYSFQFAPTTFQPDSDKLQYSINRQPSWLSLNGQNRTLWGTPGLGDIGTATFTITAAGEAGAIANLESKLVVTDDPAPTTNTNVSELLSKIGQLSGSTSVTLLPSKPFELKFPPNTFHTHDKSLTFYATLGDHTPLPAWISFDATTLRFSGITPPAVSAPQSFEVLLIVSDIPGYASSSISYKLIVSNHQLLFKPLQQTINVTKGKEVRIVGLKRKIFVDTLPIRDEDIETATANVPGWLKFDNHTLELIGTPPAGLMSQGISVTVNDKFGDTAMHSICLKFPSEFFREEISQLNITAGQKIAHKFPGSILTSDDEQITVDFGPLSSWLHFDPVTMTITGKIPEDHAPENFQVTMTAKTNDGKSTDIQNFHIQVLGSGTHRYPGDVVSTKPNPPHDSSNDDHATHHSQSTRAGILVGSTVGAIIGALIVVTLVLVLCRRKKDVKGYISPRVPRSPRKTDISRPILIYDEWEGTKSFDRDVEKGDMDPALLERTPEHPPQLNLDLVAQRKHSHSAACSISEPDEKILSSFNESDLGFNDEAGPSHRPHDSMKIPTVMARRESERSQTLHKNHKRRTTTVYRNLNSSSPIIRQIEHSHDTSSPSRRYGRLSSMKRTLSFRSASSTRATSALSTVPYTFPQSLMIRHTTQLTTLMDKHQSIRSVASPGNTPEGKTVEDKRPIDERRKSYLRKRASAQSPFFALRMSSSSYRSPPIYINNSAPPSNPAPSPLISPVLVKPGDDIVKEKEKARQVPDALKIRRPADTPSPQALKTFGESLRKPVTPRSFTNRHTTAATPENNRIPGQYEQYSRPGTVIYPGIEVTHQGLKAYELKSGLNDLTKVNIYEDSEMSESAYSGEEDDIEEYPKRTTIKPNPQELPPLKIHRQRSRRASKRANKRVSERDPTPFHSLAIEHGGKENNSSTYSLNLFSFAKSRDSIANVSRSPERPRTAIARPIRHSRTESHTAARSSIQQQSSMRISRQPSYHSRHSSIKSRVLQPNHQHRNSTTKHTWDKSRTQSSAYPSFDPARLTSTLSNPSTKDSALPILSRTQTSETLRDLSNTFLNYGRKEEPLVEELAHNRISTPARRSRTTQPAPSTPTTNSTTNTTTRTGTTNASQLRYSLHRPLKRTTIIPHPSQNLGLGLSLTPYASPHESRSRTPPSIPGDGNTESSPNRLRVVSSSKAQRPVSVEMVDAELRVGKSRKGRRTWGSSLKRRIVPSVGTGSNSGVWGGDEGKAFL